MSTLKNRLERLESVIKPTPIEPPPSHAEIMAKLEAACGQPLPPDAHAAAAQGFESVAAATAAAFGFGGVKELREAMHEHAK